MKFSLWTFLRRHCEIWQTDHLLKLLQLKFRNSRLHLWFWIISLKSAGKTFVVQQIFERLDHSRVFLSFWDAASWIQNGVVTTCLWNNRSVFYSQESRHIKQHFYSKLRVLFSVSGYFLPHKRRPLQQTSHTEELIPPALNSHLFLHVLFWIIIKLPLEWLQQH